MSDESPTLEETIARLHDSKPPATDTFTYLTIIEKSLSPALLPTITKLLQDEQLCQDIGWDLIDKLTVIPGSAEALKTIARLGNPREVIIKVLETLERFGEEDGEDEDERFSVLLGMLGILHGRLKVRAPSRFLHETLRTVVKAYSPRPTTMATRAVISLVRDLRPGATRPPLPIRQSSTVLTPTFTPGTSEKTAPDPEGDGGTVPRAGEDEIMTMLLRSFVTCVVEAFVNGNDMGWAARYVEYLWPERIVQGRTSALVAHRTEGELVARDGQIGQLASLAADLGLTKLTDTQLNELIGDPLNIFPLNIDLDPSHPEEIKLSSGGLICLTTYWILASELFAAPHSIPSISIFPHHAALIGRFNTSNASNPRACIHANPGTQECLVVMGLYFTTNNQVVNNEIPKQGSMGDFMGYIHQVTLIAVYHDSLLVRNAAIKLAGEVLHKNPDDADRLRILEDLLENCTFATLQAQGVVWLREELAAGLPIATARAEMPMSPVKAVGNRFASTEALDTLQYVLFPSLAELTSQEGEELKETWMNNYPMWMQAVNLALLIFGSKGHPSAYRVLVPLGMPEAVEQRYLVPLSVLAGKMGSEGAILADRLSRVSI